MEKQDLITNTPDEAIQNNKNQIAYYFLTIALLFFGMIFFMCKCHSEKRSADGNEFQSLQKDTLTKELEAKISSLEWANLEMNKNHNSKK